MPHPGPRLPGSRDIPDVSTGPRATLWVLRAITLLLAGAILAQPVLAGSYLNGSRDAIRWHDNVAITAEILGMVLFVAGLAYSLRDRGTLWVMPAPLVMMLLIGTQVGFGYARRLQLHVPIGVLLAILIVVFAMWVFSPGATRARYRPSPPSSHDADR